MPEFIPDFVSKKEHYKESPGLVIDFIENIGVQRYDNLYLNFTRIDNINSFENVAGVLFLATPDELSGLFTWACYDRNEPDLISTLFGSGCSSVVTLTLNENSRNGYRSFLGFFDPSARPYVEKNILTFAIPMSRFKKMLETMPESCLFDTHAWAKVYDRINE